MRTLKRAGLFFLWVLIPSVITVSVNTFSPFTLGGLLTILLYAPFLYLIKKTLSGDFDGKYSKTNQKVSKLVEHSNDVPESHLNEPAGTQKEISSEPDLEETSNKAPVPEAEPETPPEFFSEEDPEVAPASPSTADAPTKYCDSCGIECETWVKFCPVCGCKTFSVWVKKPIQVTSDPELLKKTDAKARKYLFKKRIPLITLTVLCVALAAVSSVLYINLQNALKRNMEIQSEANELSANVLQLRAKNTNLENEHETLKSNYESIWSEYRNAIGFIQYLSRGMKDDIGIVFEGDPYYHSPNCTRIDIAYNLSLASGSDIHFNVFEIWHCEELGLLPDECIHQS